jgi:hypothetical protein
MGHFFLKSTNLLILFGIRKNCLGSGRPVILLKKSHDSVRRAFIYNIFSISKRTMRLIKMLYEAYRRVRTVKHLTDTLPIKNILKEVGSLPPFLFNVAYTMP